MFIKQILENSTLKLHQLCVIDRICNTKLFVFCKFCAKKKYLEFLYYINHVEFPLAK